MAETTQAELAAMNQRLGAATLATAVTGWAIKHAMSLPADAIKELCDLITKDDPK